MTVIRIRRGTLTDLLDRLLDMGPPSARELSEDPRYTRAVATAIASARIRERRLESIACHPPTLARLLRRFEGARFYRRRMA